MKWFGRKKKQPGWVALSAGTGMLRYVHGVRDADGSIRIIAAGAVELHEDDESLAQACAALSLDRYHCALILEPEGYQMVQVDAPPNVSGQELVTAARWRARDLIDWPVDQATVDILPIPRAPNSGGEQLFVIAARNEHVARAMRRFDAAGAPLEVIDIAETAQRNISALFEQPGRATAFLRLDEQGGLLTVTSEGDLFVVRRIDVSQRQLGEQSEEARRELLERVLVEVQRTLDSVERQYSFLSVSRLVLGPERLESGLTEFLRDNLGVPVIAGHLPDVMRFDSAPADPATQSDLFPLFGCVLRGQGVS